MVLRLLLLASAFFLAYCSVPERDNPFDPDGVNYKGAAPSKNSSSSSVAIEVVYGDPIEYKGETYETVVIGTQTWFKRNLNYDVEGSRCYGDNEANCVVYGRLYDWATAMALDTSCNMGSCASEIGTKHQGVCPGGWHIPSNADWNVLMKFVNPSCSDNSECKYAGDKLRASSGWNNMSTGKDDYGFSALPSGYGSYRNDGNVGFLMGNKEGLWWSTSEYTENFNSAYYWFISDDSGDIVGTNYIIKNGFFISVRCVKD